MKYFSFLLISLFIISCSSNRTPTAKALHQSPKIYLDANRNRLEENDFQERWRNKDNNLSRWDYATRDSGRVASLNTPLYSLHKASYSSLVSKLETLTGKTYPAGTTFLLHYTYKDDLCSTLSTNTWSKRKIRQKKSFTSTAKIANEKEFDGLLELYFFEEGIDLHNQPALPDEYYFADSKNFLRNNIFLTPSLCGSMALLKPNGEILVRNGEYLSENMAQHLKPENWNIFFPEEFEQGENTSEESN